MLSTVLVCLENFHPCIETTQLCLACDAMGYNLTWYGCRDWTVRKNYVRFAVSFCLLVKQYKGRWCFKQFFYLLLACSWAETRVEVWAEWNCLTIQVIKCHSIAETYFNSFSEKSWFSCCSEGDSFSTSYVHHTTQGEPTKLIEIISDCNLEEDHNKILTILSQHINSNAPQCLKVGSFIIELASEYKAQDENHPSVCSSKVKISVPSSQDKDVKPEIPVLEIPDSAVASCNNSENVKVMRAEPVDKLREKLHWGKGLPFYAGVSPAGRLVVYKCKANPSPSGLIQVGPSAFTVEIRCIFIQYYPRTPWRGEHSLICLHSLLPV